MNTTAHHVDDEAVTTMSGGREVALTGELRWNIKQSFRDYVGELPDGEETWTGASGGVTDGDLLFPAVALVVDSDSLSSPTVRFSGSVRFAGYGGMLRVDVKDPWLEVGETTSILSADVAPAGSAPRRAPIATVDGGPKLTEDGAVCWCPDRTVLTVAGAALLGSVYPPGTEAAGFTFRVVPA